MQNQSKCPHVSEKYQEDLGGFRFGGTESTVGVAVKEAVLR